MDIKTTLEKAFNSEQHGKILLNWIRQLVAHGKDTRSKIEKSVLDHGYTQLEFKRAMLILVRAEVILRNKHRKYSLGDMSGEFKFGTTKYSRDELIKMAAKYSTRGEMCKFDFKIYKVIMARNDAEEILEFLPRAKKKEKVQSKKIKDIELAKAHILRRLEVYYKDFVGRVDFINAIAKQKRITKKLASRSIDELIEEGEMQVGYIKRRVMIKLSI